SYAVIRAAAVALGQTKNSTAYDTLIKMIDFPSWRDTIRASGLSGLAALEDKRALELGFKYRTAPNPVPVRVAALSLLGSTGKGDARTFDALNDALKESFSRRNLTLLNSAAEALVMLGDERGLAAFQDLAKKTAGSPQLASAVSSYEARLRAK